MSLNVTTDVEKNHVHQTVGRFHQVTSYVTFETSLGSEFHAYKEKAFLADLAGIKYDTGHEAMF